MFKEKLREKQQLVEKELHRILDIDEKPEIIYEAMRYSVFAGGKRLRPVLCLSSCELLGGDIKKALPVACAIELIHTYSLIHDDLPAMDNDDLRRGKPTNHKVYGEAIAILAGDGLLNLGYEVLVRHALEHPEDYERILKATNEIATASGCKGIIGGQVVDILSQNTELTYEELKFMHEHKTGALIEASVCAGAYIAGATEEEIHALREYARLIGFAFQIKDDILDVIGEEEKLGKKVGSDKEKGKFTFVNIFGLEKSQEMVVELTQNAIKILDRFGEKAEFLKELSNYLIERVN
ncbi:farnesyl-diphosphate synthase [Thermoanaerobacter thermohydrosulfuricus]|uniref:Farnesyl diphosphate synthase n=5 Tax=Thermoanaerobacter TaxID=1754 RepID=B0K9E3_THEP3|nr:MULTISPECIES: farnesyl diphosphate synthase [Thermoanaerobacter]EGD52285.1 Polyprenyl synthetase [Thermoanaerobacter ethanolicus JW 200]ABY94756.1 Polyprenyl synthetase [Thermoanaerobacter pseudethanolicus ATCC 33223]ADV79704.1 Polyprenyl synthetase [Thermoanaerobacter brockii subsp. finnii Ako-1]EIW01249.1 geranylgeranyl pyrophosphate synthase [Thermoanaerobacter siderophilus SR4]EMT40148.1 Geranylgeranyl pyrophosphate synthase [Thermoanaerobacter thermohydrosulfuricus WC1]